MNVSTESEHTEESAAERIALFRNMLRCCYPVEFWEYDSKLNLLSGYTDENELMTHFFKYSSAFSSLEDYLKKGNTAPALIHSRENLYWIADFLTSGDKVDRVFLIGPFAMDASARQKITNIFESANHPLEIHRWLLDTLARIPLLPSPYLFQFVIMFHYAVTEKQIAVSDIRYPYISQREKEIFTGETEEEENRHWHTGVWEVEQKLMQAIRTGNADYRSYMDKASIISSGIQTPEPGSLRSGKDSVILFVGLCSRAAIDGGLPPEIAYDMCDRYVQMIESGSSIPEIIRISDLMVDDYTRKVRSYQADAPLSRMVRACCDYIHLHLSEELSLGTLASICGYSEYYLSRKFKKETGVSLSEYILHAKLDQACLLLKTTAYSIQDISDSLSFSSRSYFSSSFRKYIGVSPKEYREHPDAAAR